MYEGNYKENEIFYDAQILPIAGHAISEIRDDALDKSQQIAKDDAYFDSIPSRYSSLIPTERYSSIRKGIDQTITAAYAIITGKITSITNAIIDYCNGDGIVSEESTQILDGLLNNASKKDKPNGDPTDPPTKDNDDEGPSTPKNDPPQTTPPSENNNDIPINNNPDDNNSSDGDKNNDEEVFIPQTGNNTLKSPSVKEESNSTDMTPNDKASDINPPLLETSNGIFQIPSPITRDIDDIKKSGVAIPLGITAAAAAAIGSKIYYDKKKDDSENDEENDLDSDINNETKTKKQENNEDFISDTNAVEFKKDLINNGEVKE